MKNKKIQKSQLTKTEISPAIEHTKSSSTNLSFVYKLILVVLLGFLSYKLAVKYKSYFIVGTINNTPVTRMELNKIMSERYGKQAFEEMVNEKIIADEIKKQGVAVTDEEVNMELEKIKADYGSEENMKAALETYGLTVEKAKESIKKNLSFRKLIEKNSQIAVTDESITKYYNENKTTYTGKKLDEVKENIREMLYQQELYQKSQEYFSGLRQSAKVESFL